MLRLATTRAVRHLTRQAAPACYAGAVRGYAAGGDIVKDVFVDQQKKFRALMDATKDLEVPVGGDRAAIKAYAEQRKAIMAKLGIKTTEERIVATLQAGMEAGMSAREYLNFAEAQRTAMGVEDVAGVGKALSEALSEMEKKSGKPLMTNDAAGMKALYAKVEGLVAGMGGDGDVATESMVDEAEYEVRQLEKALGAAK